MTGEQHTDWVVANGITRGPNGKYVTRPTNSRCVIVQASHSRDAVGIAIFYEKLATLKLMVRKTNEELVEMMSKLTPSLSENEASLVVTHYEAIFG